MAGVANMLSSVGILGSLQGRETEFQLGGNFSGKEEGDRLESAFKILIENFHPIDNYAGTRHDQYSY